MARGFRWENDELFEQSREVNTRIDGMISTVVEFYSSQAEQYMRQNARWTDQTGNARNGLAAEASHVPFRYHLITLSHGVAYGIWLEVRFGGRYQILTRTQQVIGPQVLDMIGRQWGRAVSGGR